MIATADTFHARKMVETARALNPSIAVIVRSHDESEAARLRKEQVGKVLLGEEELAAGIVRHVVQTIEEKQR